MSVFGFLLHFSLINCNISTWTAVLIPVKRTHKTTPVAVLFSKVRGVSSPLINQKQKG